MTDDGDEQPQDMISEDLPEGETASQIGYKRPPAAHQFKRGRSGNPKGRPRKREISLLPSEMRRSVLAVGGKPVKVNTPDGLVEVSGYGAVVITLWKKALGGQISAIRTFIDLYGEASYALLRSNPDFSTFELNERRAVNEDLSNWEHHAINHQRRRTRKALK